MPNQELDGNWPRKCVKFKIISSKNKSLIYFHAVQGHGLKHGLSCFLCSSSTLSSTFRSKIIRRAWLIDLNLYLDLIENVNDYSNSKAWHCNQVDSSAGSFQVTHSLSSWPARCWALILVGVWQKHSKTSICRVWEQIGALNLTKVPLTDWDGKREESSLKIFWYP